MAATTTYTCDNCAESSDGDDRGKQYWEVVLSRRCYPELDSSSVVRTALWCRACMVRFGLLPSCENDPPMPETPPTMEDLVRAIVREQIEDEGSESTEAEVVRLRGTLDTIRDEVRNELKCATVTTQTMSDTLGRILDHARFPPGSSEKD